MDERNIVMMKRMKVVGLAGILILVFGAGGPVQAALIAGSGGNTSTGSAQTVDGAFSLEFQTNIESGNGTNDSTTIPHVTIEAVAETGNFHFYSFTANAGDLGIFDIDFAQTNPDIDATDNLDTWLALLDTDGTTVLDENDDTGFQGPGDTLPFTLNSFLTHTFATSGTFFIQVGEASTTAPGLVEFAGTRTIHCIFLSRTTRSCLPPVLEFSSS